MSNVLDNSLISDMLKEKFGDDIYNIYKPDDILTFEINRDIILDFVVFIRDNKDLQISFLTDLCGIHYPENKSKELGVIYHFHSWINNYRIRVKSFFPREDANIQSLTSIYNSANWQERETYDFFGIKFLNHPNLKRIMNSDDITYHPLLKEYHLEDSTRTDKDDSMFGR